MQVLSWINSIRANVSLETMPSQNNILQNAQAGIEISVLNDRLRHGLSYSPKDWSLMVKTRIVCNDYVALGVGYYTTKIMQLNVKFPYGQQAVEFVANKQLLSEQSFKLGVNLSTEFVLYNNKTK